MKTRIVKTLSKIIIIMTKYFKITIIAALIIITGFFKVNAQSSSFGGGISTWEILPQYLVNGKLFVDPNSSSVTFQYKVIFYRTLNTGSGVNKWKLTDVLVAISMPNANNVPVYFTPSQHIYNSDFANDNDAFLTKIYSITISKSSFILGNPIILAYQLPGYSSPAAYSKVYQWQTTSSNPPPPSTTSISNGVLFRTQDGKVYSVMDGYARHIVDANTLYGVYNYSKNIVNKTSLPANPIGNPIGPNTTILRDTNDDKIYFAEGAYIRYIASPAAANRYHLRVGNSNPNIYLTSGISGYTVGPPIYDN
jgi:hypothetical protein